MEIKKLSEDILEKINEFQEKNSAVVKELGEIELSRLLLEDRRKLVEAFFSEITKDQEKLLQDIEKKYGKISINLSTGEYSTLEEN